MVSIASYVFTETDHTIDFINSDFWHQPLSPGNYLRKHKIIFACSVNSQHWDGVSSWKPPPRESRTQLCHVVNIMAADALTMKRAIYSHNTDANLPNYSGFSTRIINPSFRYQSDTTNLIRKLIGSCVIQHVRDDWCSIHWIPVTHKYSPLHYITFASDMARVEADQDTDL